MAKNYVLTGCIPIGYGGLTTALLNRSAQISTISKEPVQILTFRDREFPQTILNHLKERNGLRNGVIVTNIYDWLRSHELTCGGELFNPEKHHIPNIERSTLQVHVDEENGVILRELIQEQGRNGWIQVNHLRQDGTIAVIDNRRDQGRCIITCDRTGKPERVFSYSWPFYHAWLDTLFENKPVDIIVDNDHEARFLTDYQRENVSIIHYFHGTHCNDENQILSYAEFVFSRLDRFDLFVFPTFSQCYKAQEMFPQYSGFDYIPHALPEIQTPPVLIERSPKTFVVASRLESVKRLNHAIWAVGEVSKKVPDAHIHILGTGSLLKELENQANNMGNFTTFHGHCSDVPLKLKQFSFYLLTSTSEGLPVALLEAMQAGCIPIAYNINFGPSDVIIHGVNGWLVEAGNQESLRDIVQIACNMPEELLQKMRESSMETAKSFSVKHVLSEWNRCKLAARKRKAEKMAQAKLLLELRNIS